MRISRAAQSLHLNIRSPHGCDLQDLEVDEDDITLKVKLEVFRKQPPLVMIICSFIQLGVDNAQGFFDVSSFYYRLYLSATCLFCMSSCLFAEATEVDVEPSRVFADVGRSSRGKVKQTSMIK